MTSTERRAKELAEALEVAESGSDLELQILAAALVACAREEAKWWNGLFKTFSGAYRLAHMDERNERLAALERAELRAIAMVVAMGEK